ncbi:hypothetical protein [Pseudomonas moorei]|uniref:Uncharacterized protein n=1 Tax=Pseudomonas moorei TaxID=395599 RepID=A0A1H1EJT2_9PSED|nr:hypothetical protein [Pseudomonas moorei]KAB0507751.1 hypothetical protein F7R06_06250 [Pseudomonas moorei]SDQ88719.1 hypothetical protein SAMN04490195_2221 [Pseudomonas moorei]
MTTERPQLKLVSKDHNLDVWKKTWTIIEEQVVCPQRAAIQPIEFRFRPFRHAIYCPRLGKIHYPWNDLLEIIAGQLKNGLV